MIVDVGRATALTLFTVGSMVACSSDPVDRAPPVAESGQNSLADYRIEGADVGRLRGEPLMIDAPPLAWANGGDYLAITLRGSSSCPRGPGSMVVTEPQHVTIHVVELRPGQEVCSADDAPYVTIVEVPDGLDRTRPVTAVFHWGSASAEDTTVTLSPPD